MTECDVHFFAGAGGVDGAVEWAARNMVPCPRVVRADAEVLKSTGGWDHGSSGLGCARIASERSEDVLKGRQAVLRVGWAKLVFSDLNTHPELQS